MPPICSYVAQVKLTGFHDTFVSAPNDNQNEHERRWLLVALEGTVQSSEQALMQKVLESSSRKEAEILAKWFVKHPSQEAITHYTKLASEDYFENSELTLALAGMGDTNVLNLAKESIKRPNAKDWLGYYIFAQSPLPEAGALAKRVIQRGNSKSLEMLVQGYEDSRRPDRLDRIKEIVALKAKSRDLIYWLRHTLGGWAYDGDKQAESLLSQLPVGEPE